MSARLSVLLPLALDEPYDYLPPVDAADGHLLRAGQFVKVPLRNKDMVGVIWGTGGSGKKPQIAAAKLRRAISLYDLPPLPDDHRAFIDWVADYTLAPKGAVLKLTLNTSSVFRPVRARRSRASEEALPSPSKLKFSQAQDEAAQQMRAALAQNKFKTLLLDGMTGSGKTEICFDAIKEALAQNKQALMLLPEIALTSYMRRRFEAYAGVAAAVWHSGLTPAARRRLWLDVASGRVGLVIGARSALFLPFQKLGLVVVDEEHDDGFKQEDGVIYHARDMAIVRGALGKFPVVLSSATPCLETLANIERGRTEHLTLPQRVRPHARPPEINIIDMRQNPQKPKTWIAPELAQAIKAALARQEQSLLFLNRRGYAPLVLCRKCGHRFACPNCDVWLAQHGTSPAPAAEQLLCHHCGFQQALPPLCPHCDARASYAPCGPGIERVFEEAQKLFPQARLACLSRDLPRVIDERRALIEQMAAREIDILIGTQMVAKGLHFPYLTVAGIIDADLGLANADLRASEHSFQLLQQVAGRTGRDQFPGTAFLQTYMPDHPVMRALAANDRARFLAEEAAARHRGGWPPYGRLVAVILAGTDRRALQNYAHTFARSCPQHKGVRLLGPAPAPIFRRKKLYRMRLLIKAGREVSMQAYMRRWRAAAPPLPRTMRCAIDVDPHSFL